MTEHPRTSARCKVCASPYTHQIDQMLTGKLRKQDGTRFTYAEVVKWAAEQGCNVSKPGLSRHHNAHLAPRPKPAKGASDGLEAALREVVKDAVRDALRTVDKSRPWRTPVALPEPVRPPTAPSVKAEAALTLPDVPQASSPQVGLTRKGKSGRTRAMPRSFQAAITLEADLNRIQLLPQGMRGPLFTEVGRKHGAHPRTVRRWLEQYEKDGIRGITVMRRSDAGQQRLPNEQVKQLHSFIEQWPGLRPGQIYRLIKLKQPELLEYPGKTGQSRTLSTPTFYGLVKQVRTPVGETETLSQSESQEDS